MTKAEQKALFMEFYGVTPELKKWAREKWASGTAALTQESLDYMNTELIIRKRKAEAAAETAKLLEKENESSNGPASSDGKLARKLPKAKGRRGGEPAADTPIEAFCRDSPGAPNGDIGAVEGADNQPRSAEEAEASRTSGSCGFEAIQHSPGCALLKQDGGGRCTCTGM